VVVSSLMINGLGLGTGFLFKTEVSVMYGGIG
jgi:hypothetical protein